MIGRLLASAMLSLVIAHIASAADARGSKGTAHSEPTYKEPRPFNKKAKAWDDVDAAFARARRNGKRVILAMGANWCHDSRSLGAKFETPAFQSLIADSYELVYVDVGHKSRNIDIAQAYGIDEIVGTPTVLILSSDGDLLNGSTAPTWRNAASRTVDDALVYFQAYAGGDVLDAAP